MQIIGLRCEGGWYRYSTTQILFCSRWHAHKLTRMQTSHVCRVLLLRNAWIHFEIVASVRENGKNTRTTRVDLIKAIGVSHVINVLIWEQTTTAQSTPPFQHRLWHTCRRQVQAHLAYLDARFIFDECNFFSSFHVGGVRLWEVCVCVWAYCVLRSNTFMDFNENVIGCWESGGASRVETNAYIWIIWK